MALYLTDAPNAATAFDLAADDPAGIVVLIQDGVTRAAESPDGVDCRAVADDARRRGLDADALGHAHTVTYTELVELIVAHPVVNLV